MKTQIVLRRLRHHGATRRAEEKVSASDSHLRVTQQTTVRHGKESADRYILRQARAALARVLHKCYLACVEMSRGSVIYRSNERVSARALENAA